MANREKRIQKEAAQAQEAVHFKTILGDHKRRSGKNALRKRIPKNCSSINLLRWDITDCDWACIFSEDGAFEHHEAFMASLFACKPLLRAILQERDNVYKLMRLYIRLSPCRPDASWRAPKTRDSKRVFLSYVMHRFARYQAVYPLLRCWYDDSTNMQREDQLVHILLGNRIRQTPHLPLPLTNRMAHILLRVHKNAGWLDAIFGAYILGIGHKCAMVRILVNIGQQHRLLEHSSIPFFQFLLRYPNLKKLDVHRIWRFFLSQQDGVYQHFISKWGIVVNVNALYPDFTFRGATLASVLRRVEAWEAHLRQFKQLAAYPKELPRVDIPPFVYQYSSHKPPLLIRQITDPQELIEEGQAMRHCVATYMGACLRKECSIWTLRREEKRLATIEMDSKGNIMQISGPYNKQVTEPAYEACQAWIRQLRVSVASPDDFCDADYEYYADYNQPDYNAVRHIRL